MKIKLLLVLAIIAIVAVSCSFDRLNLQVDKGNLDPGKLGSSDFQVGSNTNNGLQIPISLDLIP